MSLFKKTILALFLVALSVGLTACKTVGPDFTSPSAPVADKWNVDDEDGLDHAPVELSEWWTILNDSTLDHLVDLVLNQNITLEMTALRVLESRARLGIATGSRYPQSQVAFGDAAYVSPPESSGISSGDWQYSLGASVAWEADFWGRYRRGIESADAAYLASIATYDQIMVLLAAQVVDSYVVIRENGEQLRIAHENVILQERSYEIAEVLFRNGSTSELDMQQALTLLLSTKATIPALETGIQRARNSMNYLLGRPPGDLPEIADEPSGIPVVPDSIHLGFPTELLRRRPDVREAELLARAQSAQIGLAKADLYPRFTLSGFMGLSAGGPGGSNFGDLFDSDAFGYSFGPSFS